MNLHPFWKKLLNRTGRALDPVSRVSEVVFGLIMVLTFTGSISAATAGREEIGVILWAALGCNVAWGIVDAFMYLMAVLMERGNAIRALNKLRNTGIEAEAHNVIREYLPPLIADILPAEQLANINAKLHEVPDPPAKAPLTWYDIKGAIAVFLLVFISTFPATLPFIFISNAQVAMRVSNGIALLLLFVTGYYLGRRTGYNAWLTGLTVCASGVLLVLLTIALGG
jgi:VIT1/CCC1 family predicted Fe2+/Mn2+ transporter